MERNYTDEQILNEARTIMANPELRRCSNCHHYNINTGMCEQLHKPYSRIQYAGLCKYYETNEEKALRETREAAERLEREEQKINHVLTLAITSIDCALIFLGNFESRVEADYKRAVARKIADERKHRKDKQWIDSTEAAIKRMRGFMQDVEKQYNHYIQPHLNKVMTDKETKKYDFRSYDDHLQDAHELAKLLVLYFEKTFGIMENSDKVFALLESMQGCGVLDEKDLRKFDFKR